MSFLSLQGVSLIVSDQLLLDRVDWTIQPHDRIALVGRNGAGKSSLLKLLQGELLPERGQVLKKNGLRVAGLTQEVPLFQEDMETVHHFLVNQFSTVPTWEILPDVETMATRLGLDLNAQMNQLSGGMKRRVLLAAALIAAPDILLLDEPTNHLDMAAIEWLESYLKHYTGTVLLVTHDREFLAQVARRIVEIDRGQLYTYDCNYETFLDRREARLLSEDKHHALFDKRLAEEEVWIRKGVQARRTRNEGRVRALKAMREAHKQRRMQMGKVKATALDVTRSGQLVVEAQNLNYSIDGKSLIQDFSLVLTRGDKVGIVGPNGCGKTTLIRLLLGEITPDSGKVKQGTSLSIAYFDQLRRQLDDKQTVMASVADGADYVMVQGNKRHVTSYLSDFLFPPERFNQPVSSLSGGERNRLLLAKLFSKSMNLLVMDEPTNDLDIETLELLETLLVDYPGTLLLISHDRAFINHVVTSVLVYEEDGTFHEYVGGYDAYREQKKQRPAESIVTSVTPARRRATTKLSFNEQRELAALPQKIENAEKSIIAKQLEMTASTFYQQDIQQISQFKQLLEDEEAVLSQLLERWEVLEARQG